MALPGQVRVSYPGNAIRFFFFNPRTPHTPDLRRRKPPLMSPIMFGFARQRQQMLEAELARFVDEMPPLGMTRLVLIGDLARGTAISPHTGINLVVEQETEEPPHRRPDFWVTHLRPSVNTTFHVYTPDEFVSMLDSDPLLIEAADYGDLLYG